MDGLQSASAVSASGGVVEVSKGKAVCKKGDKRFRLIDKIRWFEHLAKWSGNKKFRFPYSTF